MTRAARSALTIDVLVVSDRWKDAEKVESIVRRAVTRAGRHAVNKGERSLLSF